MKSYKSYSDDGHGWLAVKRKELEEMGILDKITPYSYQRGQTVYLEEDCDMSLFVTTKKAMGYNFVLGSNSGMLFDAEQDKTKLMKIDHKNTNGRSPIRSYEHFSVEV